VSERKARSNRKEQERLRKRDDGPKTQKPTVLRRGVLEKDLGEKKATKQGEWVKGGGNDKKVRKGTQREGLKGDRPAKRRSRNGKRSSETRKITGDESEGR